MDLSNSSRAVFSNNDELHLIGFSGFDSMKNLKEVLMKKPLKKHISFEDFPKLANSNYHTHQPIIMHVHKKRNISWNELNSNVISEIRNKPPRPNTIYL